MARTQRHSPKKNNHTLTHVFLKDYHILYFTTTTILTINAIAIKDYYNLSVAYTMAMIRSGIAALEFLMRNIRYR